MSERLVFVGPGRLGLALGYALWNAGGVERITYCGRRPDPPAHPLFTQGKAHWVFGLEQPPYDTTAVFLTVPDEVLPELAHALAGHGSAPHGCAAFHCSGARGTDALAPLHARSYRVGTFHPFQSVAHSVTGADRLVGATWSVSGVPEALAVARRLLSWLDGTAVSIPVTRRPLYHAAAVLASNYLAALVGVAGRLLVRSGVPGEEALPALLHLARGTLDNVQELGLAEALTGPVVRGDVETIHLHFRALESTERVVYAVLGMELVEVAGAAGVEEERVREMRDLFRSELATREGMVLDRGEPARGEGRGVEGSDETGS